MNSLDRKLWRDLWKMKGQALAIVFVIIGGVATFVMFLITMDSLNSTRDQYYRDYRFADVFASLKRAPEGLKERIRAIPGVDQVETRVTAGVKLNVPGFSEPVTGRLLSVPDTGPPHLNVLYLRKGRMIDPKNPGEALVSEKFAEAHGLSPGDRLGVVINGRWKKLTIVGIALSPEFVLQSRPGSISPDYRRYGILWMGRKALAAAYDMDGAFNDVVLKLVPGTDPDDLLPRLDGVLARYGGLGAYTKEDQLSNRFLREEFRQLQTNAEFFPMIFIGVAAFLLNVVISRLVKTEREQIAILKAFGYRNRDVGIHYSKLVILIVLIGVAGGTGVGVWMAQGLGRIYMEHYRFPYLSFDLDPKIVIAATIITVVSALAGTLFAVWRAVKLPPAEAMRPEPPMHYRKTMIEYLIPERFLSQPSRIIARNIQRKPVQALLSIVGIAMACAIMVTGSFFEDSVDYMVQLQFVRSQKQDMTVTFTDPVALEAAFELRGMEGIEYVETFRTVPVRLRFGHRGYRTAIQGIEPMGHLNLLLDENLKPVHLPPSGIVLTDYLGTYLGVKPGDLLTVEVLEGNRPVRQVPVVAMIRQYIGVMGYMDLAALNRFMKEGPVISGAYLSTDERSYAKLYRKLTEMPRVIGAAQRREEIRSFYEVQAEAMLFFTLIATILAGVIAFGVVYNSARISLSERSHEMASLRVLGYTRGEISYILLGELGLLTLAAIPLGFLIGKMICVYMADAMASDLFRIPVVLESSTYSLAAAVVLVSAAISGLIVRRRLDRLDLVAVLKTGE
ncbi:MAG: ABC transporter permease [Nitrospirae bacterium]|nr:ABC transporter permease [Nitrospirota bacterium]